MFPSVPQSYKPDNVSGKALDPEGELCLYLKGVVEAREFSLTRRIIPMDNLLLLPLMLIGNFTPDIQIKYYRLRFAQIL
ncbi:hypothetical protein CR513_11141, partial [Mucuna pruriens]